MILIHLFYSVFPRAMDTPCMRIMTRVVCAVLFAIVVAGAASRGDEPAPTTPAHEAAGRGNVSIIHVSSDAAPSPAEPAQPVHATESTPAGVAPSADHEIPASEPATPTPAPGSGADSAAAHGSTDHVEAAVASTDEKISDASHVTAPVAASHEPAPSTPENPSAPAVHAAAHEVESAHKPAVEAAAVAIPAHRDGRPEPVDDFAESGRRFWQAGDFVAAEKAFTRALTANVPVEKKRNLVLEMAELYRGANQLPKASAVLEKFIKTYPNDREVPEVLLRLGVIYRDLGVYSMATSRFFQVLNSTLRVTDEDIPEYRKLAMKARLEIAETYAMQGNLSEAEKYFSRLQLLDLESADRERVLLRGAQLQFTLKQWLAAEKALANFLASSPESPHVAEVRYMRAKALDELGRKQEAVEEVVALLQMKGPGEPDAAQSTAYWKRRCANELANRFYEQGDFLGALAVYQALARASMEPSWRWPAIYQIGLCFERMDMPQRAAEAYDAILAPGTAPAAGTKLPESLASLQDMAKWRRSQLAWLENTGRQLESLAADKPAG